MSFATWYESAWQHPGLAWLGCVPILFWAAARARPHAARAGQDSPAPISSRRWIVLATLQVLIVLDALCTGVLSPISAPSALATASSVAFVILGDARFFFLLADPRLSRRGLWSRLLGAVAASTAVSAAAYAAHQALPALLPTRRHLFLTYEILMYLITWILLAATRPVGRAAVATCRRRLLRFVSLQYGLWVLADVVILSAQPWSDLGFALRTVPNALYYVAFVPFAVRFATISTVEDAAAGSPPQTFPLAQGWR